MTSLQNQKEIQDWLHTYVDDLYRFALSKVGKKETAEDLVQDTFLSAYKNLSNFQHKSHPKTWLFSILNNKIIDYYRSNSRQNNIMSYLQETESSFNNSYFNSQNHGRWTEDIKPNYFGNSSDSFLLKKEFQEILQSCLDKLPSKLKNIFISKYLEDKKGKEICKEFNISSSNYWTIAFRSKTIIRECLESNEYELDGLL